MSAAQEAIVRKFLTVYDYLPEELPYDWMSLDGPYLEGRSFFPFPDEVFEAYEATRNSAEDRARDADDYAQDFGALEMQLGIYPWEWLVERRKKDAVHASTRLLR